MIKVDKKYQLVLKQFEERITGSRYKLSQVINTELLSTYWEIGRTILEQKEKAGWEKKIIEKLANDLKAKFPNMRGLSEQNLEYMQTFASAWPAFPFLQQPAAELQGHENHQINDQQPLLSQIAWTHHMVILDKAKTLDERIFYIKEVIRNAWSITMLKINIETCLYKRKGNAITEQELGREIEIMMSPTDEKKTMAKDILATVKGQEIKNAKQ
jgi:predicted nuclease of restriction endonuclease-like (RecB) superfamily